MGAVDSRVMLRQAREQRSRVSQRQVLVISSRVHGRAWSTSLMVAVALASSASIIGATSHSNQPAFTEAKAENDDDGTDETTTILNWSGTHSVTLPQKSYYEPESIQDLVDIVSEAYKKSDNENKIHIRPIGSALSPNGIAFSSQGMVSLSNLDKILEINKDKLEITVQAGARVSQVLDALRPHGLTLPNLASIAEQQIGGFVSVGAHGTGAKIPPVDEFVTALTLVTPSKHGVVKMTEKGVVPFGKVGFGWVRYIERGYFESCTGA